MSFADSDFDGRYVIAFSADSQTTGSNALLEIDASGGNFDNGYIDINDTGTVNSATLTGTYILASNGHVDGSFNTVFLLMNAYVNVTFPFSTYLISPTEANYLVLRTQRPVQNDFEGVTGGGIVYAQPAGVPYSVQWAGGYAIELVGNLTANGIISQGNSASLSGQISADGRGTLAGTLDNPRDPLFPELQAQGSYSVGILVRGARRSRSLPRTAHATMLVMSSAGDKHQFWKAIRASRREEPRSSSFRGCYPV
jgi:hypothetical protein